MSIKHPMAQAIYDKIEQARRTQECHKAIELFRRYDGMLRLYMPHEQLCRLLDHFIPSELENCPDLLYLQGVICEGQIDKVIQSYNSLYKLNPICRQRSTSVRLAIDCHVALALHSQRESDYPGAVRYLRQGIMWLSDDSFDSATSSASFSTQQLHQGLEAAHSLQKYYEEKDHQRGCFDTTLLQAWFLMEIGNYEAADIQLQLLNDRYTAYQLCDQAICELYQTTAHLHWLQGNLDQAASLLFACRLKAVTLEDRVLQRKTRHLLANLYRDQGRFEDADRWYKVIP